MTTTEWLLTAAGAAIALYAVGVIVLIALGRRSDARALAGFIPDCLVILRRVLGDSRVWPGPTSSLEIIIRAAYGRTRT